MNIAPCITELIGHTPLLELARFGAGLNARVVAKCEFFNPISVKDRAAWSMIAGAEARGEIQAGVSTLIEATSGNTGMALAYIGRMKGYQVILCMSEGQSVERRKVLRAFGAEVVLTPKEGGTLRAKEKALELCAEIWHCVLRRPAP